ncbi:MAG: hypothetical protein AAF546_13225 [Verrucomicrobiota bacterium]
MEQTRTIIHISSSEKQIQINDPAYEPNSMRRDFRKQRMIYRLNPERLL